MCQEKMAQQSKTAKQQCTVVCHVPEDNSSDFRQISLYQASLQDHLKQYPLDKAGPCKNYVRDLCEDGNMCTVNHQVSNDLCTCLSQPLSIDCNAGIFGTEDKCVPSFGCVHEISKSFWTWEVHDTSFLEEWRKTKLLGVLHMLPRKPLSRQSRAMQQALRHIQPKTQWTQILHRL